MSCVDHEARETANAAATAIKTHEDHCGERWAEARTTIREGFAASSAAISKLHTRINRIIWTMLVAAIGLIANVAVSLWIPH